MKTFPAHYALTARKVVIAGGGYVGLAAALAIRVAGPAIPQRRKSAQRTERSNARRA